MYEYMKEGDKMTSTKALQYLSRDPITHMDMMAPIKRGSAQIIYAGDDGVCIFETKSSAHIMTVETPELGKSLISEFGKVSMVSFHQEFMLELFDESRFVTKLENYQAVYTAREKLAMPKEMTIMPVSAAHLGFVISNYDFNVGAEYLRERVEEGKLFGGFVKGEMVGFIGIHSEGSIGIFKVLSEYRGKGYGAGLAAHATNYQLSRKITPFVQFGVDNEVSLATAKKLGYKVSNKKIYWLF